MSADVVDDLHAAESRIGELFAVLSGLLEGTSQPNFEIERQAKANAYHELQAGWCRPSCEDHDHDDPNDEEAGDCGCPSHEQATP